MTIVNQKLLPVMRPRLPKPSSFSSRIEDIWGSGVFSNFGPQVEELESRLATRFKVDPEKVVVLSSATVAMAGLVMISEKSSWRVPSWTFVATPLSILQGGKSLQFADVSLNDHMLSVSESSGLGTIVTLPFGTGIPNEILNQPSAPDIIDAAASLASVTDLRNLTERSSVVFSLHATKYLGAGEGGVAVVGNSQTARLLRSWANFGFSAGRLSTLIGTNAKMSEVQAAIAHACLDQEQDERNEWEELRRHSIAVAEALSIDVPYLSSNSIAPYWIVAFKSLKERNMVEAHLQKAGIESRRWWGSGCHSMPSLKSLRREGELANTEWLASTTLGLPYFRGMTQRDFSNVGEQVKAGLARAKD